MDWAPFLLGAGSLLTMLGAVAIFWLQPKIPPIGYPMYDFHVKVAVYWGRVFTAVLGLGLTLLACSFLNWLFS